MAGLAFRKIESPPPDFSCGNASIDAQIKNGFFETELHIHYLYEIVTGNGRCIGYFCLKFREIFLETLPEELSDIEIGVPFSFYAVEIKYLAIKDSLQGKGVGTGILRFILRWLEQKSRNLPYRFVYIDALTELKDWYTKEGFRPFNNEDDQTAYTVPMFYDLIPDSTLERIYKEFE